MSKTTEQQSSKKLFTIFTFAYLATIAIATIVCFSIYAMQFNEHKDYSTQREAEKAAKSFIEAFDNVSVYLKFVAKAILTNNNGAAIDKNNHDDESIAKILQERIPDDIVDKEVFAFTIFDWIGPDKHYVANSVYGVFPKQSNLDHRTYLEKTDKTPWKVFHSDPVVGIPSGQKVIPVGMGITDESGAFYGTIATGIRINKIEEKISQLLYHSTKNYSYLLLNEHFKPVMGSIDFYKGAMAEDFLTQLPRKLDEEIIINNVNQGFLQSKINAGKGVKYVFFSKIENYPYYFLLGENYNQVRQEILFGFIPYLIIILLTTTFCFVIFYRYHILMIEPIIAINKEIMIEGTVNSSASNSSFKELKNIVQFIKKQAEELKIRKKELSNLASLNNDLQQRMDNESEELSVNLKEKMDFIKTVSHEVRSPVQGVAAITKGLVEHWNELVDEKKYTLIKEVFKNSNKLFSLVNNLLDNSKMESGKMSYNFERVNLKEIVEEVIDEFYLHLEEKKTVSIKNETIDAEYYCVADSIKIMQVLRNIISNAIKFTDEGVIKINLEKITEKNRNFVKVLVSDQGIGVPEEEKNLIFDSFFQSSRSKNVAIGTGLGLSICKDIVHAHGGNIWVENGKEFGSVFFFTLPEAAVISSGAAKSKKLKNILLIDDDETSSSSLGLMLYDFKFNITNIQTGHEAITFLNKNKNKIDLIFLDMILPDMDGMEILKLIKKDNELKKIPVILQSGISSQEDLAASLELGSFATLVKPFDKKSLLKIIEKL